MRQPLVCCHAGASSYSAPVKPSPDPLQVVLGILLVCVEGSPNNQLAVLKGQLVIYGQLPAIVFDTWSIAPLGSIGGCHQTAHGGIAGVQHSLRITLCLLLTYIC